MGSAWRRRLSTLPHRHAPDLATTAIRHHNASAACDSEGLSRAPGTSLPWWGLACVLCALRRGWVADAVTAPDTVLRVGLAPLKCSTLTQR